MAWKKMAAAHFLLETSPIAEIASQIVAAEVRVGEGWPLGTRSQYQNALASPHKKNR